MVNNEHFSDLLLDYLYGLLDEEETGKVRAHVQACPQCQAALKEAQEQQQLLTRAAQVCRQVPPFLAPDFQEPVTSSQEVKPASQEVTPGDRGPTVTSLNPVAGPTSSGTGRGFLGKLARYSSLVLAASLLLTCGIVYRNYHRELAQYQTELAQAEAQVTKIESEFTATRTRYESQQKEIPGQMRYQFIHAQVSGPTQYHAEIPGAYRLATRNLDGQPQQAKVQVQVLDPASKKAIFQEDFLSEGDLAFHLPTGLHGENQNLLLAVEAKSSQASARLEESLQLARPTFVTHLAMNKASYRIDELLFFRTLTLESFSLKPPQNPVHLRFALVDLEGRTLKQLEGVTGPGGISGGEFALTHDIPSGIYFLEVQGAGPENSETGLIRPQRRRLEIARASTPLIELDRAQYQGGDKVNLGLRTREQNNGNPLANQAVTIQPLDPQAAAMPGPGGGNNMQQFRTDNRGVVNFQLPAQLNTNKYGVEIQVHDGKRNEKLVQNIPVVPSQLQVDFFPEGGDLVEGLPSRVYFRVRSPQGDPAQPQGRIIILASNKVLYESEQGQGLGVFTLTPRKDEAYTVRITDPQMEFTDAFKGLGIKAEGITLGVPGSVTHIGEPLEVAIGNKGQSRRLLILVTCRGQVVEQMPLLVPEGKTAIKLNLGESANGILRVTLYENRQGDLDPVAERLIYRVPSRRLDLMASMKPGMAPVKNDANSFFGRALAGKNGEINIQGRDEKKQPTHFWALAAIVEEKSCNDQEVGLPAHFYLASEVRGGEDLEDANLLLRDDAAGRQALDLFLGTQGWRRFLQVPNSPALVARNSEKETAKKGVALVPNFFSKENAGLVHLKDQYLARVRQALASSRNEAIAQGEKIWQQREIQAMEAQRWAVALSQYQALPQVYLQLGLAALTLLALLAGVLLILAGFVQMIRRAAATGAFAGALVSVGLGLLLYLQANPAGWNDGTFAPAADRTKAPWSGIPPVQVAQAPQKRTQEDLPLPSGQYSLKVPSTETLAKDATARGNRLEGVAPLARKADQPIAFAPGMGGMAAPEMGGLAAKGALKDFGSPKNQNQEIQRRFHMAQQAQDKQAGPNATVAPAPATLPSVSSAHLEAEAGKSKGSPAQKMEERKESRASVDRALRQFAYQRLQEPLDTILWHPALFTENGTLQINFDLPPHPANYRVLVQGNTPEGRLGFLEGKLEVQTQNRK